MFVGVILAMPPPMLLQQALEHFNARRLDQAEVLCRRVLADDSRQKDAAWLLANVLARQSRHEQARYFAEIAAQASPTNADRQAMWLKTLNHSKDRPAALATAREIAARFPDHQGVQGELVTALRRDNRVSELIEARRALTARFPSAAHLLDLGSDLSSVGRHADAEHYIDLGLAADTRDPRAPSSPCFWANGWSHISPEALFERHLEINRRFKRLGSLDLPPLPNTRDSERQINLGYMTGDAKQHSVAYFMDALLRHADRRRFKIHLYANVRKGDDVTRRFVEMADVHRVLTGHDEAGAVSMMRRDRIDILVDLSGLTSSSGVWLMRSRVAPVQANYLGYCNTTGVPGVDVRLVDAITDPPGWADALATERLVRIDGCFLCYRAQPDLPAAAWAPTPGRVTYGCFNAVHKFSQACLDAWAGVMRAVPESVLLLKSKLLADASVGAWVRGEFARRGVDGARIELLGRTEKGTDHLALYNRLDVALDPFPYNGTTTTCEALVMGTPLVALAGDRHPARVSASILTAAGCPELIAGSVPAYIELAAELGRDTKRLRGYHETLRARTLASSLCDAPGFMRRLEAQYLKLWREWCEKPA